MKIIRPHPMPLMFAVLCVGMGAGFGLARGLDSAPSNGGTTTRQGGYEFINPLLSCDASEDIQYAGYSSLQQKLQSEVNQLISQGYAKRISVYFRDMDSGDWTGVHPNDQFIPASLLKLPLYIAYLEQSTTDTQLLDRRLSLNVATDANAEEYFKPAHPLAIGQWYTVQEMLNAMIQDSDNNATAVLNNAVSTSTIDDVYENFAVQPSADINADSISPEDYMRFFRILYNATYIGRTRSQKALATLAQTTFSPGLVAGVPAGVPVSHKFGERTVNSVDPTSGQIIGHKNELADCGIVYYPHSPYGICVMTEGSDLTKLANVISQISKTAYAAVQAGLLQN